MRQARRLDLHTVIGYYKIENLFAFCRRLCYDGLAALLQSGNGKGVHAMEYLVGFLVSVGASVVGYYVCKWLDRHGKGR